MLMPPLVLVMYGGIVRATCASSPLANFVVLLTYPCQMTRTGFLRAKNLLITSSDLLSIRRSMCRLVRELFACFDLKVDLLLNLRMAIN
ncbi:hypothetical protein Veis_2988 [Verminephrobacter eiseniae EF01-2]|uniref:Uncharacterized protein n=1 Tax=Verminephrobacter eiseniae (strain EF01-2) TaxID=391735 RepID=A1WM64_VEREI|nr:hypothetical protein Veis_2988 [Verminephrobacter eiseniae EF01-2]